MILGHYAPALISHSKFDRKFPILIFLICTNVPEFLWLLLGFLGIEATVPASLLEANFRDLHVDMIYSHNLAPAILQSLITGLIVYFLYSDRRLAVWCAGLVLLHIVCDVFVGFEHQIFGKDSPVFSMNSYKYYPHIAILLEFGFSMICVFQYDRMEKKANREISFKQRIYLYLVFSIGILSWLPAATIPLGELPAQIMRLF